MSNSIRFEEFLYRFPYSTANELQFLFSAASCMFMFIRMEKRMWPLKWNRKIFPEIRFRFRKQIFALLFN